MTEEKLKELAAVMSFQRFQFERAMARLWEYQKSRHGYVPTQ